MKTWNGLSFQLMLVIHHTATHSHLTLPALWFTIILHDFYYYRSEGNELDFLTSAWQEDRSYVAHYYESILTSITLNVLLIKMFWVWLCQLPVVQRVQGWQQVQPCVWWWYSDCSGTPSPAPAAGGRYTPRGTCLLCAFYLQQYHLLLNII